MTKAAFALAALLVACAPACAGDSAQERNNKRVVLDFYEKALNQKDFEAASPHLGPGYIQHNPRAEDGVEGFRKFIQFRRERFPNARSEVKRALVDGDMVVLHVHGRNEPGDRGVAIIELFRLEAGKIVEHWDAIQPVPETAANSNGMF